MSVEGLPLKVGHSGATVRDLHRRLVQAGFSPTNPLAEEFDDDTEMAIRRFQESRRIDVDGIVGHHTWMALDEAAHRLGDRLLYRKSSPMLRGDDVAELQQRLGALGFDAGRVDAIFGPDTAQALETFQRNAGLQVDGILGPDSLMALTRLGGRSDQANVATVREREQLLAGSGQQRVLHFALGEWGGLGAVIDTCARHLRHSGVRVDTVAHPDQSHHARVANNLAADAYLALVADPAERCTVSYFATTGFESAGGLGLAGQLVHRLGPVGFGDAGVLGQRLPVLRETRMPAVVLRIGPIHRLVRRAPIIATAISQAVSDWAATPTGEAQQSSD